MNRLLAFPVVRVLAYYGYRIPREGGGDRGRIRCPFHDETLASFTVYLKDNKCHCFGCNLTLDSIGLVREFDKIRFTEAIIKLGKIAGVSISKDEALKIRRQFQRGVEKTRAGKGDDYWLEQKQKFAENFIAWYQKLPYVNKSYHYLEYFWQIWDEIGLEKMGLKELDECKDLIVEAKIYLEKMEGLWSGFMSSLEIPREYWGERVDDDLGGNFIGNRTKKFRVRGRDAT